MDERSRKLILANISIVEESMTTNKSLQCRHLRGNADGISGNISYIFGDVSGITGNVSCLEGDLTEIHASVEEILEVLKSKS